MSPRADPLHHPDGEARWIHDERWSTVARATTASLLAAHEHLLVVAAHPDDECLGAGALIADAASLGVALTIVVLTDGEASHPRSPSVEPSGLASMRRAEAGRAAAVLAPTARIVHAGLADGGLRLHQVEAVAAIDDLVRPGTLVIAPWTADGHPDHDAAGQAATRAVGLARERGQGPVALAHYLVWLGHWGQPDDLPWAESVVVDATLEGLSRSDRALAEHRTQRQPLSPAQGDEPLLTPEVLAPSRRGFTTLVLEAQELGVASPSATKRVERVEQVAEQAEVPGPEGPEPEPVGRSFDAMFADDDDPWSSTSWYERRKRDLVLATLRQERYDRVLDLGCSTGVLTTQLAHRADAVVAVDASSRALAIARHSNVEGVAWIHAEAPAGVQDIEGDFDLVVLSEVGYFLAPFDLWLTLAAVLRRLAPGGELLLVHWRHPTEHIPSDGPSVHARVRDVAERWATSRYEDADVLVDGYVVTR